MTLKNTVNNITRKMLPFITTTVMTTNGGNVQATPPNLKERNYSKGNTTLTMHPQEEFLEDINPGYERKVKCNVYKLVEK
ncbi:MAG: hypothetical protein J6Y53_03430, partial [Alphaproteobacteria bacterium]|nr:hypothetical protein [Alphaproteobacteria bacterium]